MKNFASRLLLLFFLLVPVAANAQSTGTVVADCTTGVGLAYSPGSTRPMTLLPTGAACVSASVSASISGFTAASTGTPISVTTGGDTGTLPAGTVVVATNVGSNAAYCALGASATTASQYIAPSGGWFAFTVGASTQLTCITASSTTTVNMTGGAGLPTGTGGGGGSGGGGAVTIADGADATQGAIADAAATAGSTGTISAKLRLMSSQLDNINTNVQAAIPTGTNYVGQFGPNAVASGGATSHHAVLANTTNATVVKASAGQLYTIQTGGISASAPAFLKFYDKATTPTCNSDTVVLTIVIPANSLGGGNNSTYSVGRAFTSGISYCVTNGIGDTDNTAVAASTWTVNLGYK